MDFKRWTIIARNMPPARGGLYSAWIEVENAPMSIEAAKTLLANGELLMSQRKVGRIFELLVKTPARKPDAGQPFRAALPVIHRPWTYRRV